MTKSRMARVADRRRTRIKFGDAVNDTTPRVYEEYVAITSPNEIDQTPGFSLSETVKVTKKEESHRQHTKYISPALKDDKPEKDWRLTTACVKLSNLPYGTSEDEVFEILMSYGRKPRRVKLFENRGICFVTMGSHADALEIIERSMSLNHMIVSTELIPPHKR